MLLLVGVIVPVLLLDSEAVELPSDAEAVKLLSVADAVQLALAEALKVMLALAGTLAVTLALAGTLADTEPVGVSVTDAKVNEAVLDGVCVGVRVSVGVGAGPRTNTSARSAVVPGNWLPTFTKSQGSLARTHDSTNWPVDANGSNTPHQLTAIPAPTPMAASGVLQSPSLLATNPMRCLKGNEVGGALPTCTLIPCALQLASSVAPPGTSATQCARGAAVTT